MLLKKMIGLVTVTIIIKIECRKKSAEAEKAQGQYFLSERCIRWVRPILSVFLTTSQVKYSEHCLESFKRISSNLLESFSNPVEKNREELMSSVRHALQRGSKQFNLIFTTKALSACSTTTRLETAERLISPAGSCIDSNTHLIVGASTGFLMCTLSNLLPSISGLVTGRQQSWAVAFIFVYVMWTVTSFSLFAALL